MSTQEERITALEKDSSIMKRDIIYKLDDTNSAVTMLRGVLGLHGQDLQQIKSQVKVIDVRIAGIDLRLEGLNQEVRSFKEQQDIQGQDIRDIKRRLDSLEVRIDEKFGSLEGKFEQVFQVLTTLVEQRFPPA